MWFPLSSRPRGVMYCSFAGGVHKHSFFHVGHPCHVIPGARYRLWRLTPWSSPANHFGWRLASGSSPCSDHSLLPIVVAPGKPLWAEVMVLASNVFHLSDIVPPAPGECTIVRRDRSGMHPISCHILCIAGSFGPLPISPLACGLPPCSSHNSSPSAGRSQHMVVIRGFPLLVPLPPVLQRLGSWVWWRPVWPGVAPGSLVDSCFEPWWCANATLWMQRLPSR